MSNLAASTSPVSLKVDGTNYVGAAGITDLTSEPVDTQGAAEVTFLLCLGAVVAGAVTSVRIQHGTLANGSDKEDVAGSTLVIPDTASNQVVLYTVYRPSKRYLWLITDRGTQNVTVDRLVALPFGLSDLPAAQGATVAARKFINGTTSGTA